MTAAAPHKARIPDVPFVDRVYGLKVIGVALAELTGADEVPNGTTVKRRAERGRLWVEVDGERMEVLYREPLTRKFWAPKRFLQLWAEQNPTQAIGANDTRDRTSG